MLQELTSNLRSALSKNLKIGVLLGGSSSERKISLRSGRAVLSALKGAGLKASAIDPKDWKRAQQKLRRVDVAFVALHGKGGEDGEVQRSLDRLRVPYIGSDVTGSRYAFDKALSKKIFVAHKIPTAPYILVDASNWKKRLPKFPVPFFVKPATEGSSIGAFSVENFEENAEKIGKAVKQYGRLLVEKRIEGREFTVGVLGNKALPVVEMRPKNSFYDYHAKYTKGMTDYHVPADIPQALAKKMQRIALQVHRALKLRDFSRVDMMTDLENRIYVLEANSIPGFTELSLLPKAAQADGISFEELCCRLVSWAVQRSQKRRSDRNGKKA